MGLGLHLHSRYILLSYAQPAICNMQFLWIGLKRIGHVLNEQGTGYEYLKSIELKNEARHLKEHPNISKFTSLLRSRF